MPEAGIPDEIVYRQKWRIALALYDRARQSGVRLDWREFDEEYGSKPLFLQGLSDRELPFVGEVPTTFPCSCWLEAPPHGWRAQEDPPAAFGCPVPQQREESAGARSRAARPAVGRVLNQGGAEGPHRVEGEADASLVEERRGARGSTTELDLRPQSARPRRSEVPVSNAPADATMKRRYWSRSLAGGSSSAPATRNRRSGSINGRAAAGWGAGAS